MDNIERLECVYYPGPVPSDSAVLTVLCFVFDKIHFPGVYLPKGDYDKELLNQEIRRLEGLENRGSSYEANNLIGMLRFLEYRLPLDGILEYPSSRDSMFGSHKNQEKQKEEARLARAIYDVNYPPRKNFEPMFTRASVKGSPQSDEAVVCMGDFYYQAGAIPMLPRIDCRFWTMARVCRCHFAHGTRTMRNHSRRCSLSKAWD